MMMEPPAKKMKCCGMMCPGCCNLQCVIMSFIIFILLIMQSYCNSTANSKFGLPSNSYTPLIVFCNRTIGEGEAYKAAWGDYATATQASSPGIRAMFSFITKESATNALQLYFFDSANDFVTKPADPWSYTGTSAVDWCQIYGGWSDAMKTSLSADPKVHYAFVKPGAGFVRSDGDGFTAGGPPMLFISKRTINPGHMDAYFKDYQPVLDAMFGAAPGLIASLEYPADTGAQPVQGTPDLLWSIRFFNDFQTGFKAHFPIPSWLMVKTFSAIISHLSTEFPYGVGFGAKADLDGAVAANAGNAQYDPYVYEEGLIGPMPDMAKGKTGGAFA